MMPLRRNAFAVDVHVALVQSLPDDTALKPQMLARAQEMVARKRARTLH
jgi:hypothetical protein